MAWGKATSVDGDGTSAFNSSTFTPSKTMTILNFTEATTALNDYFKVGNSTIDSGSNYAWRSSQNGAGDGTGTSRSEGLINQSATSDAGEVGFRVIYAVNVATEEKLFIHHIVDQVASGAGTAPNRREAANKWANTSNQINIVGSYTASGTYNANSNISVIGSDITPVAAISFPTNDVQLGSRAEITDTRKMYSLNDTSKSELKAYYHFEDNGTNAQTTGDGFGSSADMTVTGATYVTGKVGSKAISFDGTNDYAVIGLPSASSFNFLANTTHEWTVAFWFKNASWGGNEVILSTGSELDSAQFGIGIRAQSGGNMNVHFCNGTNQNRFTTSQSGFSTDGNWHFIVITAKKSDSTNSLEFWEDGTSLGTASNSGKDFVDNNASQAPYIGQTGVSTQWLSGQLDELSIWNRRLSDSEISTLYNSGTGQVIPDGMSKSWQEIGA